MTLETRNSKREEAITSLQKIAHYAEMLKNTDFIEDHAFYESLLRREQVRVQMMAEEMSCE